MKRELITISDSGAVAVPNNVKMNICEIAELFGVYYQSTKRTIRAIEKTGVTDGDYSMSCTVEGVKVYPEYYGLDMVMAVAFRVQSAKAEIFRQWIVNKVGRHGITTTLVLPLQNAILN
ncbi:MAG TPA: hypothetical protein PKC55_14130 [Dysgonomonas sp.]|uniref:hypothetical protein n=1 Tax=unclassified Dysgonomonas TaxID=2630389 RepID=UPI0025BAD95D|nr:MULTISPECIES: hypothetical protein [unclassified Dysgonomonas]HML65966.1 hypothetical protein [Dysgonomonas sp.]